MGGHNNIKQMNEIGPALLFVFFFFRILTTDAFNIPHILLSLDLSAALGYTSHQTIAHSFEQMHCHKTVINLSSFTQTHNRFNTIKCETQNTCIFPW